MDVLINRTRRNFRCLSLMELRRKIALHLHGRSSDPLVFSLDRLMDFVAQFRALAAPHPVERCPRCGSYDQRVMTNAPVIPMKGSVQSQRVWPERYSLSKVVRLAWFSDSPAQYKDQSLDVSSQ
jgi:hypothetical protein